MKRKVDGGKLVVKRFGALVLSMILGLCMMTPLTGCSSETYTPSEKSPVISSPTIGKDGVLRVGVDASSSPFAGQTDSGIVGLNVDIAAAIADELGLKLEITDVGSDPAAALENGTVDIVMGIDKSTSVNFWVSDAYLQSGVALFSTSADAGIPPTDGSSKIAAQVSSMSAWEVNKQFGEESLVSTDDLETAFSDLNSGSVQYVAADAIIGTFAAHKASMNVSIVGLLEKSSGYGVGVLDTNDDLKQIISDTLVKLQSNGMIDLIESKWLGTSIHLDAIPLTADAGGSETAGTEGEANTEGDAGAEGDAGGDGESGDEGGADGGAEA